MAFDDLKYGWHREHFTLRGARLVRSSILQQLDEDGEWVTRDLPFSFMDDDSEEYKKSIDAYESPRSVRYSTLRRIVGTVEPLDTAYVQLFLGVPGSKKKENGLSESRIAGFQFEIAERDNEAVSKISQEGWMYYFKPSESTDDMVSSVAYADSSFFDYFENATSSGDVSKHRCSEIHYMEPAFRPMRR